MALACLASLAFDITLSHLLTGQPTVQIVFLTSHCPSEWVWDLAKQQ
jgi:hypothetical protein